MKTVLIALLLNLLTVGSSYAQTKGNGLFDVELRRAALAQPAFTTARAACLAIPRDPAWSSIKPIAALKGTEDYVTDGAANDYAWAVMVLTGRTLAGDMVSEVALRDLLLAWARARAFADTEIEHDAYYALKRVLLPTVVAFSVLQRGLDEGQKRMLSDWIDPLVRKTDQTFDGVVGRNNHRYLADSLLMTWGAVIRDEALYTKGQDRYRAILAEARPDGSLALETRRGARALWYMRQSLASLTVMAEVAATRGTDFYDLRAGEVNFDRVLSYLLNGIAEPNVVMAYASENYIPGGEADARRQDLGFMAKRSNGRHYMAWVEPLMARDRAGLATKRLKALFVRSIRSDRPLIDEFVGGNATCFWGR
ncbi:alginate lyase family protein [Microvirga terrestris]|uniref:Alginate lyase family protein n=1 Tax=Microvirga terrestris TaxID=2791024 RepID=A0ABS0HUL3_9HYPH|nr:alginate lyase family protein [Microvirga terrestris]MBF9197174.1 alginate lyase family protein [Microvirga terrestris]